MLKALSFGYTHPVPKAQPHPISVATVMTDVFQKN